MLARLSTDRAANPLCRAGLDPGPKGRIVEPMTTRRNFVSSMIGAGVSLPVMRQSAFRHLINAEPIAGGRAAVAVAEDETYWRFSARSISIAR